MRRSSVGGGAQRPVSGPIDKQAMSNQDLEYFEKMIKQF